MAAKYQRTEGVCLRRVDYSNTSQVATFLTPDRGRLSFMAKGVKRAPKKGISTAFDLLCRYELLYSEPRFGSLNNLTGRELLEDFRALRTSLERMMCAYYAAEVVLNFTMEEEPCRELYDALLTTLRLLGSGQKPGLGSLLLEMAALRHHGSLPEFILCAECRAPLKDLKEAFFSPAAGGALCPACRGRQPHGARGIPAYTAHLAVLDRLARHRPSRPNRINVPPYQIRSMTRLTRYMIQYVLGKRLRMWDCSLFEKASPGTTTSRRPR